MQKDAYRACEYNSISLLDPRANPHTFGLPAGRYFENLSRVSSRHGSARAGFSSGQERAA
jgi:hypothetical protein